jgi:hypothetical protein
MIPKHAKKNSTEHPAKNPRETGQNTISNSPAGSKRKKTDFI